MFVLNGKSYTLRNHLELLADLIRCYFAMRNVSQEILEKADPKIPKEYKVDSEGWWISDFYFKVWNGLQRLIPRGSRPPRKLK